MSFRTTHNINFHDEKVVDFAQNLFSKDPIDEDMEIVNVRGFDAKSQMVPSSHENAESRTHFAQFDLVSKAPQTDSDAMSDFRRDYISIERFLFAILNEIRDAVNNGREPIMVTIGLDNWTCNAERLYYLFKTYHKRYGPLSLIISELKSNQSYDASKDICTEDGGLPSSPHGISKVQQSQIRGPRWRSSQRCRYWTFARVHGRQAYRGHSVIGVQKVTWSQNNPWEQRERAHKRRRRRAGRRRES